MVKIRILSIVSLFVSLLCVVGLVWAYMDQKIPHGAVGTPDISQSAPTNQNEIKILALGDSLTRGYGDDNAKGYVGNVVDQLRTHSGTTISISNLAINGQTSEQLSKQLSEQEVLRQIGQANVILMTIGGNDLNQQAKTMNELTPAQFRDIFTSYKNHFGRILDQIRAVNPKATLYLIGLYNPYLDQPNAGIISQIIRQWNNDTADIVANYPNMVFVPTFDLFALNEEQFLYTDHFHPNSKGYQRIAGRLLPLLTP
ncbi:MAG TPA: GDSL-type esterase/lipase family protein [Bacillota bacterium]|nr:GDSL-type esterase/lipase family protein [Bacillota bacterium]